MLLFILLEVVVDVVGVGSLAVVVAVDDNLLIIRGEPLE